MYITSKKAFGPAPLLQPATPPLIDNLFAPDIFTSGFSGFAHLNGVIVLTMESVRFDHSQEAASFERVVVGRVTMGVSVAQGLVAALNLFLEQQGLSPSRALAGDATFQ